MKNIHYIIGSALEPIKKPAYILHIVNDTGVWGGGFVIAISKKYELPEKKYRAWYRRFNKKRNLFLPLGVIQSVPVEDDITIMNMVAQHGTKPIDDIPPIRYEALEKCLETVNELAYKKACTIHMPRIGAVRSGGDWTLIEKIIKKWISVETYIYTLKSESHIWKCEYEKTE